MVVWNGASYKWEVCPNGGDESKKKTYSPMNPSQLIMNGHCENCVSCIKLEKEEVIIYSKFQKYLLYIYI